MLAFNDTPIHIHTIHVGTLNRNAISVGGVIMRVGRRIRYMNK